MVAPPTASARSAAGWIVLEWKCRLFAPLHRVAREEASAPAKSSTALRPSCDLPKMFEPITLGLLTRHNRRLRIPPQPYPAGRILGQYWLSSPRAKELILWR